MADTKPKVPAAFAGAPVKPVDHRNPPKPAAAGKSAPFAPDHFTREGTAPISAAVKPVPPPKSSTQPKP